MNVHHEGWLKHSTGTTPEGSALYRFCCEHGFTERVQKPTRGKHLLDLVLTDMGACVTCTVLPQVEDHSQVLATLSCSVPTTLPVKRELWLYKKADWKGLQAALKREDWSFLEQASSVDEAQEQLTQRVLDTAKQFIPRVTRTMTKSTHPWMNERCLQLVAAKRSAEGTEHYKEKLKECSQGILEEFNAYTNKVREELKALPRSSKKWWKLAKGVTLRSEKNSAIPPLKDKLKGEWVTLPEGKCTLFLETLLQKYQLAVGEENTYTELPEENEQQVSDFLPVRARTAAAVLKQLKDDKATGPDGLDIKLLRKCAQELAVPVAKLTRKILATGEWPAGWKVHWVLPLYKKKAVWDASNYRGVHLTAQLSKVVERLLAGFLLLFLEVTGAYGHNQFAYRKKRGAKDLLGLNVVRWLWSFHTGKKVGLYCSDVSGAFDRVDTDRLLRKLWQKGVRGTLWKVLQGWLQQRTAYVAVEGKHSQAAELKNMVYQGTVLGPPLWNTFFEDSRQAVNSCGYEDTYFADDLNCYRSYSRTCNNEVVKEELEECQQELHKWGRANRVQFDAGKESFHVLCRDEPEGEGFKLLGVEFDEQLAMDKEVDNLVRLCSLKLRTLLRGRRFFTTAQLVQQYKSNVLPFLEYPTPALYHATQTVLNKVDQVQDTFLRKAGLTKEEALNKYRLAPLSTRRDIAMLGLVHRTVLGHGPPHFQEWFFAAKPVEHRYQTRARSRAHKHQLHDYLDGTHSELLRRSALGLPRVYNALSSETVACNSVQSFQRELQKLVREKLRAKEEDWEHTLSPRRTRIQEVKLTNVDGALNGILYKKKNCQLSHFIIFVQTGCTNI